MRYLVGFVLALVLVASPLRVGAQNGQEASASQQSQEATQAAESTYPQLDWSLVEAQNPGHRARAGLIASAAVTAAGAVLFGITFLDQLDCSEALGCQSVERSWHRPVRVTGGVLMVGGAAGMIVSGALLGARNRQLRKAHHPTPRRVQWDLARSRLVF